MRKFTLITLVVLLCSLALTGCGIMSSAESLEYYDFGVDKIPSVNSVVGGRMVTSVESGTSKEGTYKSYTYKSETVSDDLVAYLISDLMEDGWYALKDFDLGTLTGNAQIATESLDSGQIIVMDVTYNLNTYEIKMTKGVGTLMIH